MPPLRIAIAGCGSRGRTYARLAAHFQDRYQIVAAADPDPEARAMVVASARPHACQEFSSDTELLDARPSIDLLVIATQDSDHFGTAMRAMELGYDLLLEKPAATTLEHSLALRDAARRLGRKVVLCFVLRHTPFYRAVRDVIRSGKLGEIISIQAVEGVEPYHQAHSFVRGHWSRSSDSCPMILAKSSHDMDILNWLVGAPARAVASFGGTKFFHRGNMPQGATERCTDGCPHAGSCFYDAHRYLKDKRSWLGMVLPLASAMDDDAILEFLRTSPWGRCAWRCDNDVVDHQVLAIEFQNGVSGTFTMTAFDSGRTIAVMGTKGVLKGGADGPRTGTHELWFRSHDGGEPEPIPMAEPPPGGYAGHGGGDHGIMNSLDKIIAGETGNEDLIETTIESHLLAFAAERSRLDDGRRVLLEEVRG